MKKIFLLALLIATACGTQKVEQAEADSSQTETQNLAQLPVSDLYSDGRSELIKTATLRFQVADLRKSREQIDISIRKYSGFIESSDLQYENPVLEEHLTIRILSIAFEPLLKEIEQQAVYMNSRKVLSDNVAKEFVDLESRLRSKREMEQRYADIVRRKASTTEDLLKAEYEIGKLHEEIEAVVSRMNFLRDQVRYSTIKLEIYQIQEQRSASVSLDQPLGNQFSEALYSGWRGLTSVMLVITHLWPLIFLAAGGWCFLWYRKRRKIA